jgi:hypothetical protein
MRTLFGILITLTAPLLAQTPEMVLRGDRFAPLAYDQLTPEQKAMADKVLSGEIQGGTGEGLENRKMNRLPIKNPAKEPKGLLRN